MQSSKLEVDALPIHMQCRPNYFENYFLKGTPINPADDSVWKGENLARVVHRFKKSSELFSITRGLMSQIKHQERRVPLNFYSVNTRKIENV